LNITYNRKYENKRKRDKEKTKREIEGNTKRENIEWKNVQK
jgi:hypothetical protein